MRTFLAIDLPKELRTAMHDVCMEMPGRSVQVPEENIHLTLYFLGDIDEARIGEAEKVMDSINAKKFEAEVRGLSFFVTPAVQTVFAKVSDNGCSSDLYSSLSLGLSKIGFTPELREYVPHITLARMKRDDPKTKDFIKKNSDTFFGSFAANSISLKSSQLSKKGAIYTSLYERELS